MNMEPRRMENKSSALSAALLLKDYLRPYWKGVALIAVINVAVGFLLSVRPVVIAPALDAFLDTDYKPAESLAELSLNNLGPTITRTLGLDPGEKISVGLFVAASFFLVSVIVAGLSMLGHIALVKTRVSVLHDMMIDLHKRLLALPMAYFNGRRAGDLLSRITNDVIQTASALDSVARGILQSSARIVITFAILFRTDVWFTFSILALGSSHMMITAWLASRVREKARNVTDKRGVMTAALAETFAGIRVIKSFSAERHDEARIRKAAGEFRDFMANYRITQYIDQPLRLALDAALLGLVLIMTFWAVGQGRISVQAAAIFFYLSQQMIAPISELFTALLKVSSMHGGAERIMEIFAMKSDITDGEKPARELERAIEARGVSFSYDGARPVLRNVNARFCRGEMTAIVGPSGSGKSTLADLILRFYDVGEGRILYDGADVREFRQREYRGRFGVVAQECLLFNATIRRNIVYSREENEEELARAIEAANAEEFIKALPDGLETMVGDRGLRLSGGQRQRIAIARAIYNRPSVLILDEATSALDSEAEQDVQKAINRIKKEITVIVIAHRLSTVIHAEKIIVLNNGEVEAVGPHNELIKTSSTYRRLYETQFGGREGGGAAGVV